jgi:hypothetical protein
MLFEKAPTGRGWPPFEKVRQDLAEYCDLLDRLQHPPTREQYLEQLEKLQTELAQDPANLGEEAALTAAARLRWLDRHELASEVIENVRRRFWHPNLYIQASAGFLQAGLAEQVNGTRDWGGLVGTVGTRLVPCADRAVVAIDVAGSINRRPTSATKYVLFDADGMLGLPALETRGQSRGAINRLLDRFARHIKEQLDRGTGGLRGELLHFRSYPRALAFQTTSDWLTGQILQADAYQLAAQAHPPQPRGGALLAIHVHESMINNIAATALSGATLREEDLRRDVIQLYGELPEHLGSDPDRDPWAIVFPHVRPLSVKFEDDRMWITIRGQRYVSGDREFRAMNMTVAYRISVGQNRVRLIRQGDLSIAPPGREAPTSRLSGREIALRALLEKRYAKVFEPEVDWDTFTFPGVWRRAGELRFHQVECRDGWLTLTWKKDGLPAHPLPAPEQDDSRVIQAGASRPDSSGIVRELTQTKSRFENQLHASQLNEAGLSLARIIGLEGTLRRLAGPPDFDDGARKWLAAEELRRTTLSSPRRPVR